MDYKTKAFFTGLIGDILLQLIVKYRGNFAGLKKYFEHHGVIASFFIASGMLYLFAFLYEYFNLPLNNYSLFLYGGLLDIIFRQFGLMKSLDSYYSSMSPLNSFIWGSIPMIIPNLF